MNKNKLKECDKVIEETLGKESLDIVMRLDNKKRMSFYEKLAKIDPKKITEKN